MSRKYKIRIVFLFLAKLVPMILFASNDIQYTFDQTDSSYSFFGRFVINAEPECLLRISFNYEHIQALAPDAKEVRLINSGCDWNRISYTYHKYIFFENTSVWLRKLDQDKQRVNFVLVSSNNNLAMMPALTASSGYYQIKQVNDYTVVEYYQECRLTEKSITKLYLSRMKGEAVEFINRFAAYASEHCNGSLFTN